MKLQTLYRFLHKILSGGHFKKVYLKLTAHHNLSNEALSHHVGLKIFPIQSKRNRRKPRNTFSKRFCSALRSLLLSFFDFCHHIRDSVFNLSKNGPGKFIQAVTRIFSATNSAKSFVSSTAALSIILHSGQAVTRIFAPEAAISSLRV